MVVIDVNVIYSGVDPNGNPWYVYIDPNTGMPVIEYPEAKVTDFDIRFPSGIAAVNIGDNEYILEEVDTGKQIRVDKVTGEIITVDPKYEDTEGSYPINVDPITGKPYVKDPETGEPFVDGDGNPINPVTGNPIGIEDIQTGDNPAGVTITINPETGFPVVEDPFTGEPIAEFDDESMSNMGIDPTSDIDFSMDDPGDIEMGDPGDIIISGPDMDGIDTSIDLDLDSMEWESEECPKSIYILSRPAGIVYNDGDTIDYTGLSIAALDKDGMDWPDPSTFTPIPSGKIIIQNDIASIESSESIIVPTSGGSYTLSAISVGQILSKWTSPWLRVKRVSGNICAYMWQVDDHYYVRYVGDGTAVGGRYNEETGEWGGDEWLISSNSGAIAKTTIGWEWAVNSSPPPQEIYDGSWVDKRLEYIQKIKAQWTTPCFETLETSFDITVFPKKDNGGSHHSGKF